MNNAVIMLEILSPEKLIFKGEVVSVSLPGSKAPFVVLHNHATMISFLQKGRIKWCTFDGEAGVDISSGFVEVRNNVVSACVEV